MPRPRDTGWFDARPCLEGEWHLLVAAETFERLTGRQARAEERARGGEVRLYPELLAAAFREGKPCRVRVRVG